MQVLGVLFTSAYLSLVFVLSLYGLHRCWILYLYFRHYKWAKPAAVAGGPCRVAPRHDSTRLSITNATCVERLINTVCADRLSSRAALEVRVLDDSTDDTRDLIAGQVRAASEAGRRHHASCIAPTARVWAKAGALEAGLEMARGEFLAIFDADFLPPTDFLKKTIPYFQNPAIGMVQTRWGHLNEDHSLLTWVQSIFLDGHFLLEHTARNRSGAFFNFNGTAGIWRREAITSSGGWRARYARERSRFRLTERRCTRSWKFIFLPDVVCPAELPSISMRSKRSSTRIGRSVRSRRAKENTTDELAQRRRRSK